MTRGQPVDVGARPGTEVILGDDVGGRAELGGQFDRVAAAEDQVAEIIDPAADRIDVGKGSSGRGQGTRSCQG